MKKLIFCLFIIGIFASPFVWWNSQTAAVDSKDKTPQIFVVAKGEGVKAIAKDLKAKRLIKNEFVFYLLIKKDHVENKIQTGDFKLSSSMNAGQIAIALTKNPLDVWVTIPDGKRSEQVAAILKDSLPKYDTTWTETLKQNEGYLYPDTYLFNRDTTIDTVVSTLKNNFARKYDSLSTTNTAMTKDQIITLASLLEREGKTEEDKAQIAGVLINRLSLGMALQVDATVQYALGYNQNEQSWWKQDLTADDLKIVSAYNTYGHPGLPPGPICSPGASALQAAANPTKSDYLFYISDKTGKLHFAKTLGEHNANIKKYGL